MYGVTSPSNYFASKNPVKTIFADLTFEMLRAKKLMFYYSFDK